MNWTNYQLLVDDLTQLPPDRFRYDEAKLGECGCLAVQAYRLEPACGEMCVWADDILMAGTLERFLNVTANEGLYLYGREQEAVEAGSCDVTSSDRYRGADGIREALRRLSVVAARYGGPPQEIAPAPFVGDEHAFLRSLRALVDHPHETVEQE